MPHSRGRVGKSPADKGVLRPSTPSLPRHHADAAKHAEYCFYMASNMSSDDSSDEEWQEMLFAEACERWAIYSSAVNVTCCPSRWR